MNEGAKLYAQQINHGQSEIWLEADGKELTPRRKFAINEVVNVTRRHCIAPHFMANSAHDVASGNESGISGGKPVVELAPAESRLIELTGGTPQ